VLTNIRTAPTAALHHAVIDAARPRQNPRRDRTKSREEGDGGVFRGVTAKRGMFALAVIGDVRVSSNCASWSERTC
jgi:hypothetical protein